MAYTNAIFYLDHVNGNDAARTDLVPSAYANNGSGLVRVTVGGLGTPNIVTDAIVTIAGTSVSAYNSTWKVTVIDSTNIDLQGSTFSSNPATKGTCVPFGGDSWTNAWKTITTGASSARIAPGDIIRIAKSPDPTALGATGTWVNTPNSTGGITATTYSVSAASNASPIEITTSTTHNYVTGDIVHIASVSGNTAANGVWVITYVNGTKFTLDGSTGNGVYSTGGTTRQINSLCVKLSSAVTLDIDTCDIAWSPGTNCNVSLETTTRKIGHGSLAITTLSGVTSAQILAYTGLPASLDLSGYKQISFWARNVTSALAAGDLQIRLYSDAACTSLVETLNLPAIASTGRFLPIVINKGSALSATVQGIAVYTTVSMASKSFFFDNFIACKDATSNDSLTLQSLISKTSTATGGEWFGIGGIQKNIICLDCEPNTNFLAGRGYCGTPEEVPVYKRETIKLAAVASSSSTILESISDSGNSTSSIQFLGGYNTSSSLKDGETYLDGLNGQGYLVQSAGNYITIDSISAVRAFNGLYIVNSGRVIIQNISTLSNNQNSGLNIINSYNGSYVNIGYINSNASHGFYLQNSSEMNISIIGGTNNNKSSGLYFAYVQYCIVNVAYVYNNQTRALSNTADTITTVVKDAILNYNTACIDSNGPGNMVLWNCLVNDAVETNITFGYSGYVYSYKHDQNSSNHYCWTYGGYMKSDVSTRTGGTGYEWRIYITSNVRTSLFPVRFSIAKIACAANSLVTVKVWMKLSNATDILGQLFCASGQLSGITTDKTATKTADTNWEELSITFTPTEAGVVDIEIRAWWVANTADEYITIEDMTITQA